MQAWRTLHEENLYPYHDQRVQHLEPGNHAQCLDFCQWVTANPELLSVILFTDEASFTRDGINNLRNVHKWWQENPHETSVTNFQRRFSVNVWCGVLGNKLIGLSVFDENLRGNRYEAFLRNQLPGLLEDIPLMIRSLHFVLVVDIWVCSMCFVLVWWGSSKHQSSLSNVAVLAVLAWWGSSKHQSSLSNVAVLAVLAWWWSSKHQSSLSNVAVLAVLAWWWSSKHQRSLPILMY